MLLNSSGPGVILASYLSGDMAKSLGAMTELEHVAYVQRAMIEIHGPIAAEQYTGAYDRKCWQNDEFQAGAWASPTALQQDLYLPAYFQTEKHTVFVGEHTSYTQLLLDMGLVDEAKQVTEFWMARWISM
jgi:monoamine oxidase